MVQFVKGGSIPESLGFIGNGSSGSFQAEGLTEQPSNEPSPEEQYGKIQLKVFPEDIDTAPEFNDIISLSPRRLKGRQNIANANRATGTSEQNFGNVFFPMPTSITFPNGYNWQNAKLGIAGIEGSSQDLENAVKKINDEGKLDSAVDKAQKGLGVDSLKNIILTGTIAGASLLAQKTGAAQSDPTASLVLKAGAILNPHLEQMFNGIGFRSFSFAWKFIPRSSKESKRLREVIEWIRWHSSPKIVGGNSRAFFRLPHYWDIAFKHKDETGLWKLHKYLPKFRRAVMTNFDVNYTGGGEWYAHDDGSPVQVDVTASFAEAEIVTKDEIRDGF